ncbi:hypothetical protein GCM10009740_20060 [Terrabacter terrae]|uniref:Uncharacterized protein n=1 Tax=Terrabacter terrae TaxID=318434 RepID=A0ABN2U6A7_9MICO
MAHLPLAVTVLLGLLTLPIVWAGQTGADHNMRVQSVVVLVVVFHGCCVWGVWRVVRWRARLRQHRVRVMQACALPHGARAIVDAAMQRSGRPVPHDREAFVLLRNEVVGLSGVDPFTAGVLVWEVTIGAARQPERCEWIGSPTGDHRTSY